MHESRPQGLELPTTEDKDETVKIFKNTKYVYVFILGHLDMSYMQHIFLNIPYLFALNQS